MALTYAFDPTQGETPESAKRKREIAEALVGRFTSRAPQNVPEGLHAVGQALLARTMQDEALAAERQGRESAQASFSPVMEALMGSSNATPATTPGSFSGDQQSFVDTFMPAALESSKATGVDPRIIVAQAALESGWGKSAPGNNYFGIKSHGQPGGQVVNTHEHVNGQRVPVQDSFRTYEDPTASVKGYTDFILQNPRYKGLREAQGMDAQLAALGQSGYATDPNYASKVGQIARGLPQHGVETQTAQASEIPDVGTLTQALQNPWLNDSQRGVVQSLLEMQLKANDPLRQAQISKLQREATQGAGIYGTPIYGTDPATGQTVLGAMGKDGTFHRIETPGVSVTPGVKVVGDELVDTKTGQAVRNVGQQISSAKAAEAEGKNLAEARAGLSSARASAAKVKKLVEDLRDDTYLYGMVGPIDSWKPNVSAASARVQSKMDQVQGTAFMEARQMLKGGGQITDFEGRKAEQAMIRMNTAQSLDDYKKALDDFNDAVQEGLQRLEEASQGGGQYEPSQPKAMAAPKVGDVIDGYRYKGGNTKDPNSWELAQ